MSVLGSVPYNLLRPILHYYCIEHHDQAHVFWEDVSDRTPQALKASHTNADFSPGKRSLIECKPQVCKDRSMISRRPTRAKEMVHAAF